ncbi:hypothetical protein Poly21_12010 [Allorhodopirellula heiligendammensis]|uniref:Uncharacterized protein n=1 Tax=Allorhodopirellula heiligendammensis TaxID=2714739 RepID=A0A5C6C393_9BACT|nr:hypothetical protein Poly21_12010 [Allorhodopirellula heiligendammensis]
MGRMNPILGGSLLESDRPGEIGARGSQASRELKNSPRLPAAGALRLDGAKKSQLRLRKTSAIGKIRNRLGAS